MPEFSTPRNCLNPCYTFEEFVVGPHNRFPQAAAQAVSENLGKAYNPLFIYGPVGLGKTHLMQAVGHRIIARDPKALVLYITVEQFMTEVIDLLRVGDLKNFREQYRNLDLLLVDDIQFLSASESTQEEFFHTFNALHQAGKQIIMTSDRPPKLLTTLEDRLRSRFEWGLIADIKSPNLETRVAILRKKESQLGGFQLDENIRLYIAGKLQSNVRELEGFLKRVQAYAQLNSQEITMSLIKEIMRELLPPKSWDEADQAAASGAAPALAQGRDRASGSATSLEGSAGRDWPAGERPTAPAGSAAGERPSPPAMPAPPMAFNLDTELSAVSPEAGSAPPAPSVGETSPDAGTKSIPVCFLFPQGKDEELAQVKRKFEEIIRRHKLKFQLEAVREASYPLDGAFSYESLANACVERHLRIAVALGPPPDSRTAIDFSHKIQELFDTHRLSLQMIPWEELNKDYRYLNLALDITLIRFKERA